MPSNASKKSPRNSPTTKFKQLEFVFKNSITEFDSTSLPKECDVVSLWISKFDKAREGKKQLSKEAKEEIIEDIVQSLIFIWQKHNFATFTAESIKSEVTGLICRAEILSKWSGAKKDDKEWVEYEFESFNHLFDIGCKAKPSHTAKRKYKEDEDSVCTFF